MPTKKTAPRPAQRAERPAIAVVERPVVKPTTQRHGFKTNEYIVYPAHGVGQILAIEEQEVAGYKLELFVISFIKDKMTLRVPVTKIATVGMRKLSEGALVKRALETLKGRARIKRTMWSRRAQEYEAKINSGDLISIAEVVRDLHRASDQPEQSYSERQLYESALDRMARELAAVEKIDRDKAMEKLSVSLAAKRARADAVAAAAAAAASSAAA
jgi:CarD family transcriptional regulator